MGFNKECTECCYFLYWQILAENSTYEVQFEAMGSEFISSTSTGTFHSLGSVIDLQVVAYLPNHFHPAISRTIASQGVDLQYRTWSTATDFEWKSLATVREVHVGDGKTYSSIRTAIKNSPVGSTVIVHPGVYSEDIFITKSVLVQSYSEARANVTHIFGHIGIAASGVTLNGFSIYPPTTSKPAITVYEGSTSILNCRLPGEIELRSLAQSDPIPAIYCISCSQFSLLNNILENWKVALVIENGSDVTIQSNVFKSTQIAVSIASTKSTRLTRNLFLQNDIAIQIQHQDTKLAVKSNVFHGNLKLLTHPDSYEGNFTATMNYITTSSYLNYTTRSKTIQRMYNSLQRRDPPIQDLSIFSKLFVSGTCREGVRKASVLSSHPWLSTALNTLPPSCTYILYASLPAASEF